MNADNPSLTDVGPTVPPPNWCLPDVEPRWELLTEQAGGGTVCVWCRDVADGVWIQAEDRVIDGRVMRSAPRIHYSAQPPDGATCVQARDVAAGLVAAADVLTCAAFDEAPQ